MDTANRGDRLLDPLRNVVFLAWEHGRDLSALTIQHLADVLIAAFLRDGVEGIADLASMFGCGLLELLYDSFGALSIVDDGVALATIDKAFYVGRGLAGDADEWVDVGFGGELDCIGADCARSAVDYEWNRLGCWEERRWKAETRE